MTNFDALKQIYEALGGEEEISGTNLDALKAIAEVAGSGGGGGGGGALIVTVTKPSTDVYQMDKTAMEIYDAMSTGKAVVVNFPGSQFYDKETSTVFAMNRDLGGDPFYNVQVWFEGNITPFAANEGSNWYPIASFS